MQCYVPGRGVCAAQEDGEYYRLTIPAAPGSRLVCTRRVSRAACSSSFIFLDTVDVEAIATRLQTPAKIRWEGPARPRILGWLTKLHAGLPEELAEIVADIATKQSKKHNDAEKKIMRQAIPLLRDVLLALPSSPPQQLALQILAQTRDTPVV